MSLYVDKKFVSIVSTKLDRFKQKKNDLWNCRCPFCGDSKKNKVKARGYLYSKKNNIFYICHNCHVSISLGNFIKHLDPNLFKEYQLETYKEQSHSNVAKPDFTSINTRPVFNKSVTLKIPTIESLSDTHSAKVYCKKRKLPNLNEIYYADDFKSFMNETFPEHGKNLIDDDPRIVLPFFNEKNILIGLQGRALLANKVRYITYKVSDDAPKVFGLNKVDFTKPVYVVEGPIDSMFLNNSLASMDAALYKISDEIGDHNYIYVYDNEPRNKDVLRNLKKTIDMGKKVCIWPKNIQQKDINDMVIDGLNPQTIIDTNTFEGLKAKLQFETWRIL